MKGEDLDGPSGYVAAAVGGAVTVTVAATAAAVAAVALDVAAATPLVRRWVRVTATATAVAGLAGTGCCGDSSWRIDGLIGLESANHRDGAKESVLRGEP